MARDRVSLRPSMCRGSALHVHGAAAGAIPRVRGSAMLRVAPLTYVYFE